MEPVEVERQPEENQPDESQQRFARAIDVAARLLDNIETVVYGKREEVKIIRTSMQHGIHVVPWKFDTDLPRACVFTVQHGVGYLL